MASSQSFSMIQRRMLSPCPAEPVKRELPLCTWAMRLPSLVPCFILESLLTRNSIWPSSERVASEYWGSPPCSITKRGSPIPFLPPMRCKSVSQLLP